MFVFFFFCNLQRDDSFAARERALYAKSALRGHSRLPLSSTAPDYKNRSPLIALADVTLA